MKKTDSEYLAQQAAEGLQAGRAVAFVIVVLVIIGFIALINS